MQNAEYRIENTRPRDCAGFTMLEVLLAMTVLVIIMLMLTTMFDQSANTWESGVRETSRALEGRTIVNLIASDLELAVMNDTLYNEGPVAQSIGSASPIIFYRYAEPTNSTIRGIKVVTYSWGAGTDITRTEKDILSPYALGPVSGGVLLDNVDSFAIDVPGGGAYVDKLPEWVDVKLELKETANAASDIEVWSYGPDGAPGGGDDVVE